MKNSKEDTIRKYLDEYLKNKSEDKRQEFMSKSESKQYAAIMAWKRRNELRDKERGLSAADVIKHAASLKTLIELTDNFNEKEMERMYEALGEAKTSLDNFHRMRKEREIKRLEQEQRELQDRINRLRETM